ncbi:MAG: hypothetical protein VYC39_14875 [Myxococcota bacterium]|nr:hypothetical protein [Myxococcota bacterium]
MNENHPRPILDHCLYQLVDELVRYNPDSLGHIRSENILFVAGAARRTNRASVRPFRYKSEEGTTYLKPRVRIQAQIILYEICLRPLFFLEGNSDSRISTIAHELWHISDSFDGTLEESRRHKNNSTSDFERQVTQLVNNCEVSKEVQSVLSHEGELFIQAWKQRPPSRILRGSNERKNYDESDLYRCIVVQNNEMP